MNSIVDFKLYQKIAELLRDARLIVKKTVDKTMVVTYFKIGGYIVEDEQKGQARAKYGDGLLKSISENLAKEFGRGFSVQNLERMRKFYLMYSTPKSSSMMGISLTSDKSSSVLRNLKDITKSATELNLSWTHYLKLMQITDENERRFYEIEAHNNQWGTRELNRQCDSALYQRLSLSRDKKRILELAEKGQIVTQPMDEMKDPYILEFTGLSPHSSYSESDLEQILINKLEMFMMEPGKGYTFVARQKRISFDERHFYIDLVFYNRLLRCFVLIDLKIGDLKHQDIGQMQMYVNYYDRYVKLSDENKTVGIILSQFKSDTLVEITLPEDNKQIFASKYETVLPSKDDLIKLIEENSR